MAANQNEPDVNLVEWLETYVDPLLGPDFYGKVVTNAGGDEQLAQRRIWTTLYALAGEQAVPED